jgi:hypothetical protein
MTLEAQDDQQQPVAFDGQRHVFVVRIWLEPREIAGAAVEWRGVIEHLPTQQHRYLNDLTVITHFIAPYLISMGVQRVQVAQHGMPARFRRWLSRQRR